MATDSFLSRFVGLARQHLGEPPCNSAGSLAEARQAVPLLGAQMTVKLAQQAAVSLVDEDVEQSEAGRHDEFLRAEPADPHVLGVWEQLQSRAGTRLPPPKVSDAAELDLGAQAGNQVYLERKALTNELAVADQLTFVLAHEMGHVVHHDSARRIGIEQARNLLSSDSLKLGDACRQATRQMELEADAFAAGLMVGMNCDSAGLLAKLLSLTAGHEHPDGLQRAEVVRGFLPVSDDIWGALLEKTATARAISRQRDEDEAAFREALTRMH